MESRALFITESGSKIGYGHLYRSIAIAMGLLNKRYKLDFYVADGIGKKLVLDHLPAITFRDLNFIENHIIKYNFIFIDIYHASWIQYKELITNNNLNTKFIGIVDSAFLDYALQTDLIFSIGLKDYKYKEDVRRGFDLKTKVYSGNDFFIFREEFKNLTRIKVKEKADRLFISMGGSDPCDLTHLVLRSLENIANPLKIDVILGSGFGRERELKLKSEFLKTKHKILFYINTQQISKLMSVSDLAIINGGNTRFELALLGVPFLSISMNSKQNEISDNIQKRGVGLNLGVYDEISDEFISNNVSRLLKDFDKRNETSKKMTSIIKNEGVTNILKLIEYGD